MKFLFSIQDVCLVFSLIIVFLSFFSTYIFQVSNRLKFFKHYLQSHTGYSGWECRIFFSLKPKCNDLIAMVCPINTPISPLIQSTLTRPKWNIGEILPFFGLKMRVKIFLKFLYAHGKILKIFLLHRGGFLHTITNSVTIVKIRYVFT